MARLNGNSTTMNEYIISTHELKVINRYRKAQGLRHFTSYIFSAQERSSYDPYGRPYLYYDIYHNHKKVWSVDPAVFRKHFISSQPEVDD